MPDPDVFDEVRSMAPQQVQPQDDAFDAVRAMTPPPAAKATPGVPSTWGNAFKGVGEAALSAGSSGLKAINLAANDILPETLLGGPGSRQKMKGEIESDPILNYKAGPEAQPIFDALSAITRPVGQVMGAVHQGISDVAGPRTADVVGDIATLAPGARGAFSKAPETIEAGHPLTTAAQAEADRMSGHVSAAKTQGLDLSPREVSPAQSYVDNAARRDLGLPGNSPVTSGVLDAADKLNVSPHYSAAQKFAPDLVQASQQGRSVARGLFDDASNMNLTFAQRQAARTEAQASYQTAKDAEAEFRAKATEAGQPELADNWDTARVYKAKLETWRDALQGGVEGHVNGLKIRKLGLADEPLSGAQAEAASVAAQHPEQFRSGLIPPKPSLLKKGIAVAAPMAGAGLGGFVGGGTGAMAGEAAGRYVGEKVLGR
jgi:hypothetical protein